MLHNNSPKKPGKPSAQRHISATPFHPRNRHQGRYDFQALITAEPGLRPYVRVVATGEESIDFADPVAVKIFNRALLAANYGVANWDIPADYLCPPVPGRADYLHYLADLLASCNRGVMPARGHVHALDIGTGASCIYPLLGASEYGWHVVGSDINPESLANARQLINANPQLADHIDLRLQPSPAAIFKHIVTADDWFDISLCNPPFHTSLAQAHAGTLRKWQNLGKPEIADATAPALNFGGQEAELWCPGGEQAFIERMIKESATIPTKCLWFTTLVSKSASLPGITAALKRVKVQQQKTIAMQQGNKQSRLVAWTFLNSDQQAAWIKLRW